MDNIKKYYYGPYGNVKGRVVVILPDKECENIISMNNTPEIDEKNDHFEVLNSNEKIYKDNSTQTDSLNKEKIYPLYLNPFLNMKFERS